MEPQAGDHMVGSRRFNSEPRILDAGMIQGRLSPAEQSRFRDRGVRNHSQMSSHRELSNDEKLPLTIQKKENGPDITAVPDIMTDDFLTAEASVLTIFQHVPTG